MSPNRSDSPEPENPWQPPEKKSAFVSSPEKKSRSTSLLIHILFLIIGLASLLPPITVISLVCAGVGFLILAVEQKAERGKYPESVGSGCALTVGLFLTGAVMFGGTCNSVVWPVVLITNSGPEAEIDWLYDFMGLHLLVGLIAGGVVALFWVAWRNAVPIESHESFRARMETQRERNRLEKESDFDDSCDDSTSPND